jgi:DegV family protein with EDD domain
MGKIKIVTDTAASMPADLAERYGIAVIPYSIQFATESYRDGIDIDVESFEQKLRSEGVMPKTAIPSPGEFTELYRSIAEPGDSIISIHVGKKISGICDSADLAAADLPDFDITVIDSNSVSMKTGVMALEAAKAAEAGKSKDEILALVEEVKENTLFLATSVELEHIKESGRIVGAEEAADSAVKVKPIIRFIDGTPQVIDKRRTQSAVLKRMIELVKEEAAGRSIKQVVIVHANVEPAALELKAKVEEALSPPELIVAQLGATLTVHLGPGSLSLTPHYIP